MSPAQAERLASALLELPTRCAEEGFGEHWGRLLATEASINEDRAALRLFQLANAGEGHELVEQIEALLRADRDYQEEIWALVKWRAEGLRYLPDPYLTADHSQPVDEPVSHPREEWTRERANARAMELVKAKKLSVKSSQREWAAAIGCSVGLVGELPLWIETMQRTGRGRKDQVAQPKAVTLSKKVEATVGEDGDVLKRLVRQSEADAKAESSPLDPAEKKVYCPKRV
jgi:hypothetical protein